MKQYLRERLLDERCGENDVNRQPSSDCHGIISQVAGPKWSLELIMSQLAFGWEMRDIGNCLLPTDQCLCVTDRDREREPYCTCV